jgi:hypothetical protein
MVPQIGKSARQFEFGAMIHKLYQFHVPRGILRIQLHVWSMDQMADLRKGHNFDGEIP